MTNQDSTQWTQNTLDNLPAEVGHCLSTIPRDSKEKDGFIQQESQQELD